MKFIVKVNGEELTEITGNNLFGLEDVYAMDVTEEEAMCITSAMESLELIGNKSVIFSTPTVNVEVSREIIS